MNNPRNNGAILLIAAPICDACSMMFPDVKNFDSELSTIKRITKILVSGTDFCWSQQNAVFNLLLIKAIL